MNEKKVYYQKLLNKVLNVNLKDTFKDIINYLIDTHENIKEAEREELSVHTDEFKTIFYFIALASNNPSLTDEFNHSEFKNFLDEPNGKDNPHSFTGRHNLMILVAGYPQFHDDILGNKEIFSSSFFDQDYPNGAKISNLKALLFAAISQGNNCLACDEVFFEDSIFLEKFEGTTTILDRAIYLAAKNKNNDFFVEKFSKNTSITKSWKDSDWNNFQTKVAYTAIVTENYSLLLNREIITKTFLDTQMPEAPQGCTYHYYLYECILKEKKSIFFRNSDGFIFFTEQFFNSPSPRESEKTIRFKLFLDILAFAEKDNFYKELLLTEGILSQKFLDSKITNPNLGFVEETIRDILFEKVSVAKLCEVILNPNYFPQEYLDQNRFNRPYTQRYVLFDRVLSHNYLKLLPNEHLFPLNEFFLSQSPHPESSQGVVILDELFNYALYPHPGEPQRLKNKKRALLFDKKLFPNSFLDSISKDYDKTNREIIFNQAIREAIYQRSFVLFRNQEPIGKLLTKERANHFLSIGIQRALYQDRDEDIKNKITEFSSSIIRKNNIEQIKKHFNQKNIDITNNALESLLKDIRSEKFTSEILCQELTFDDDIVHIEEEKNIPYTKNELIEVLHVQNGFSPYARLPIYPQDIKGGFPPSILQEAAENWRTSGVSRTCFRPHNLLFFQNNKNNENKDLNHSENNEENLDFFP